MSDIAINPVTRRVQFTGNTGTGPFAFTFNVLNSSDIAVYKNTTLLTLTADYTVTIAANGTGSVTLQAGQAVVAADYVTIIGGRNLERTTDFVTAGDLLASSLNEQLDSNVIMSQQLDESFGRALSVSPGDVDVSMTLPVASSRANQIVAFTSTGAVTTTNLNTLPELTVDKLNVDNLTLDGNTISTTNSNGNLILTPNGTGDVVVSGDLVVNGTTTTIHSTVVDIADKNITIAYGSSDAAAANGAGITVDGADATMNYYSAPDGWEFNKAVTVGYTGVTPQDLGGVLNVYSTSGAGPGMVIKSSGTSVDPKIQFEQGSNIWTIGQDASADDFKIINGTNLNSSAEIHINTDGDVALGGVSHYSNYELSVPQRVAIRSGSAVAGIDFAASSELVFDGNVGGTNGSFAKFRFANNEADKMVIDGTTLKAHAFASISGTGVSITDDLKFGDDKKAVFGDSTDLSVYFDATANKSYISHTGSGSFPVLEFNTDGYDMRFLGGGYFMIRATPGADVKLYHAGSSKLETTATGIDVTGISVSDGMSTNTSGTSNFRAGVNAGNSIASGGNYNVVVGDEAGTAITTGDRNVTIGFEAGTAITTGGNNIAIGYQALKTEDEHGLNVAIGEEALENLNAGADGYNVAVGALAGKNMTLGIRNTLIGGIAGDALTDADYNVAMGYQALTTDTLGSRSVAIGYSALRDQSFTTATNTYNTAVGYQAGTAVTTGISNTIIGGLAGDALTDADYNVAVGYLALSTDTLGSRSVAIGLGALATQNFTTATTTNNTAVGDNAGYSVTTGVQNTLIGGLAGDALNTGYSNVAVGYQSLSLDTKGARNVAIGQFALAAQNFSTPTVSYNVGVGFQAGSGITTGAYNTLIGGLAGDAITTANNNTALGYAALSTATTGTQNVALGQSAATSLTTGGQNTAVGTNALNNNTTASNNTAVGYQAGYSNTTGDFQTAIGKGALYANTSGQYNTALGAASLAANTTGTENLAAGLGALNANTTGNYNVGLGRSALLSNTTASNNTAVGYQAGYSNTTGTQNTSLGNFSGYRLTTGSYNTAVGYNSGYTTTGSYNTSVGNSALLSNTTASHNTAVGYQAGYTNTTGTEIIAIGPQALYNNTTGYENVAIGRAAGYENTTGFRNTYIGDDANQLATTGSNNTVIGRFNGNQGGLDIRTSSNYIVLSDGDGTPKWYNTNQGRNIFTTTAGTYSSVFQHSGSGGYGVFVELSHATHNYYFAGYNGSAYNFIVTGNGDVQNTNNQYGAISDVKLKENITDAASQWDDIKALTVRKYSMKTDNLNEANQLGVIAQEVETAGMEGLVKNVPDVDRDGKDLGTSTKAVKYSILYMKAVKALQEAMTRIETLEAKVTALENS